MDKDDIKGKTNEAMGATRAKTGDALGNEEMQAKGASQEAKGRAHSAWGEIKDKARVLKEKVT